MKTVAIHQPNYLPWLGYFHKMHLADTFIFLDDVEYTKRGFINRNKIRVPDGWTWLTVPVHTSSDTLISDVKIDNSKDWRDEHLKAIQRSYGKAPYFDTYRQGIMVRYMRHWNSLMKLNVDFIAYFYRLLNIDVEIEFSWSFNIEKTGTDRLVELCKKCDADRYLSGQGALDYQEEEKFGDIEVVYQNISYPIYKQRFEGFFPNLSTLDTLMNIGAEDTRKMIESFDVIHL